MVVKKRGIYKVISEKWGTLLVIGEGHLKNVGIYWRKYGGMHIKCLKVN